MTDEIAERLSELFDVSKQFWMNYDRHYREGLKKGLTDVSSFCYPSKDEDGLGNS